MPESLQIVYLCGGTGTRLGPDAPRPKCLSRVGDETLIGLLLKVFGPERSADAIFIHRRDDSLVPAWVRQHAPDALLLPQARPDGVANAVHLALPHLRGRALVVLGDAYFEGRFEPWPPSGSALVHWQEADVAAIKANFGIRRAADQVLEVIEKPDEVLGLACGVGAYLFEREAIAAFVHTPVNPRSGEREITAAIAQCLSEGQTFACIGFSGDYRNINQREDLARLAQALEVSSARSVSAPDRLAGP